MLLHDETFTSDWCQLEWNIAVELDLPVCVVIDMERADKATEIARFSTSFPSFLKYQWIEYTGMRRRDAIEELVFFLSRHTLDGVKERSVSSQSRNNPTIWYHKIDALMVFGGLDASTVSTTQSQRVKAWFVVVRVSTYVCILVCFIRLLYARGPAFVDRSSALATLLLHIHLVFAPVVVRSVMRDNKIQKILSDVARVADLRDINLASRSLYSAATVVIPIALLAYIILWEPLFFSSLYIGEGRGAVERTFGLMSGVLFLIGIITHIPLLVCLLIMTALIKLLSTFACEASPDYLHPQISALGVHRYVKLRLQAYTITRGTPATGTPLSRMSTLEGSVKPAILTNEAMMKFQCHWQAGRCLLEDVNSKLWPLQAVMALWAISALVVPLSLAVQSVNDPHFAINRFPDGPSYIYYLNLVRVVWTWAHAPLCLAFELAFDAHILLRLRRTRHSVDQIVFTKPMNQFFVHAITSLQSPHPMVHYKIYEAPTCFVVWLLIFLMSAIPWVYVRFSH